MERGQLRRKLRRIFLTDGKKKDDYRRQNSNNNKPKS